MQSLEFNYFLVCYSDLEESRTTFVNSIQNLLYSMALKTQSYCETISIECATRNSSFSSEMSFTVFPLKK